MGAMNPAIFTWARETAGLSLEDGARAIGLKDARGQRGFERLAAIEMGVEQPQRGMLLKMAKAYRRPLVVFYLQEPPKTGGRGQDFRTVPERDERYSAELDALIRDIQGRQGLIRSMLEDAGPEPLSFVGSASQAIPASALAVRIAEHIGFSLPEFQGQKDFDSAFAYLRAKIEGAGVFVLLLGNLGSHHTNIPADVFRGFAIADGLAPLLVVNDQDARPAWSFTALHELAHLWLGATGVSGYGAETGIEQYCNDVAGEILLPAAQLRGAGRLDWTRREGAIAQVSTFAASHNVSRAMVAYRMFRLRLIDRATWGGLNEHFQGEWLASQSKQGESPKLSGGGPNYYVVRRHRIGSALLGLVRRSLGDGNITYTKAAKVLGVKPISVDTLLYPGATRGIQ